MTFERVLLGLSVWIALSLPVALVVAAFFRGRGPS